MNIGNTSAAEAPAQAAGYLYQLRYALLRALKRLVKDPTGQIGIERLDDVAIETDSGLVGLDQLKHSSGEVELTDHSFQVWRTIGNWSRLAKSSELDLSRLELALVTNGSVATDSALSELSPIDEKRNVPDAVKRLREVATKSQNQKSTKDRKDFVSLGDAAQFALIGSIRVVPDSPNLAALGSEIEEVLYFACDSQLVPEFRQELEGWWLDLISQSLSKGRSALVRLVDLGSRMDYLREKYKRSVLHVDVEDPTDLPDNLSEYLFVRQILVLKAGDLRVRNAQRNFLKASAQRSKWLREALVDPAELEKYDQSLEENWSTQYAIAQDEISAASTEHEKCKTGRALLSWAETQEKPLRGASAQFLTSGSYHALADQSRLGWHPDFKTLFGSG